MASTSWARFCLTAARCCLNLRMSSTQRAFCSALSCKESCAPTRGTVSQTPCWNDKQVGTIDKCWSIPQQKSVALGVKAPQVRSLQQV